MRFNIFACSVFVARVDLQNSKLCLAYSRMTKRSKGTSGEDKMHPFFFKINRSASTKIVEQHYKLQDCDVTDRNILHPGSGLELSE